MKTIITVNRVLDRPTADMSEYRNSIRTCKYIKFSQREIQRDTGQMFNDVPSQFTYTSQEKSNARHKSAYLTPFRIFREHSGWPFIESKFNRGSKT